MNLLNQKTNRFYNPKHGNYFVFALELDGRLKLDTTMSPEDIKTYEAYLRLVFEVLHNLRIKSLALRGRLILGLVYVPRRLLTPEQVAERCFRYAAAGMPFHENYTPLVLSDLSHAIMMFKRHATRLFAKNHIMFKEASVWERGYTSGAIERSAAMRFLKKGGFEHLVERLAKLKEAPKAEDGKHKEVPEVEPGRPNEADEGEVKDMKRKVLGRIFVTKHGIGSAKFVRRKAREAGLKHSRNPMAVEIDEEESESIMEKILGRTLDEFLAEVVGNPLDVSAWDEKIDFLNRVAFLPFILMLCVGCNVSLRYVAIPLSEWLKRRKERKGQSQVPD